VKWRLASGGWVFKQLQRFYPLKFRPGIAASRELRAASKIFISCWLQATGFWLLFFKQQKEFYPLKFLPRPNA
jgi:hypothetical protein